ncbi:ROK family transcriptional regulator [Cryobacterium sp. Y50]|uniref:ROK family transcriptional regulator n=1 Tax=Cryobacterium sp. Y50 TaxID=2048286 RepID=UPI000CE44D65|nr:ROK family transcriptional regulator [Cryobacterium sp. Y50]
MSTRISRAADERRSAILTRLGAQGSASRAELARALDVSPALVTQLTRRLITDGLIVELETTASHGGRPGRLLGLASTAGHSIGVKIAADHVAFVEASIDGSVVRSAIEPFAAASADAIPVLVDLLRRFIANASRRPLLGIGVGLPGTVDDQGQGIVDSTQLGWHHVELGAALRDSLELPVLIDNNVTALSMAELLYGEGRTVSSFLVVTIGTGIGSGLVFNGAVLRGQTGAAGEIGHIPTVEDGPLCQCGNRGCLEAIIGESALVVQARTLGVIGRLSGMASLLAEANAGNTVAQKVFGDAGHLLGRALAGVVNLLDPGAVLLLGEGVTAWPHWAFGFEPSFRASLLNAKRNIDVVVESWQDDRWAQGAAALVFATPFDVSGSTGGQGKLVRQRLNASVIDEGGTRPGPDDVMAEGTVEKV